MAWVLSGKDTSVCDKCSMVLENQQVHMYANVDNEIEEVLCEKCWDEERDKEKMGKIIKRK